MWLAPNECMCCRLCDPRTCRSKPFLCDIWLRAPIAHVGCCRYDLAPSTEWSEEAELRKNRMVFIGRNLDKEVLRTALCECAVPSTA
mmetsp:Transcript_30753/g.70521  ORF Transcript_30753/g.70521 Transcript_30753/m.70521 type:complete len:87 (+) Transcript_30753:1064-1324(+)